MAKRIIKNDETGWIKWYRKSWSDELYFSEPFDKWHAWEDLCLMANSVKNGPAKQSTVLTSLEALKIRWFWSSTCKVRKYLKTLSNTGKITVQSTPSGTLITLVKWDFYQHDNGKKNTVKSAVNNTVQKTQEVFIKKDSEKKTLTNPFPEGKDLARESEDYDGFEDPIEDYGRHK